MMIYSERKYTQQLSDVEIDNYSDFYIGIYAFNKENPSEMEKLLISLCDESGDFTDKNAIKDLVAYAKEG